MNQARAKCAQRLGEGLALRIVRDRGSAAHDIDQLADLMLADMNDVTIDVVRGAAAGHQLHQGAPALGDGRRDARRIGLGA